MCGTKKKNEKLQYNQFSKSFIYEIKTDTLIDTLMWFKSNF